MSKIQYELNCRSCDFAWLEDFSLDEVDNFKKNGYPSCPECEGTDTFIALSAVPVHFKGAGWSPQGYDKYQAMNESYSKSQLKIYDRKEDRAREMAGEHAEHEKRKLKHLNEVAKRTLGPDAAIKQHEAEKKIAAAREKGRKKGMDIHD